MIESEAREIVKTQKMTEILEEMGYNRENGDFMVINMNDKGNGYGMEFKSGTRLGGHLSEINTETMDAENIGNSLRNNRENPYVGTTGSNNDIYSARAYGSDELIVTSNPQIIRELESQLHFERNSYVVPFSSDDMPKDDYYTKQWKEVDHKSKKRYMETLQGKREGPKTLASPDEKAQKKEMTTSNSQSRTTPTGRE